MALHASIYYLDNLAITRMCYKGILLLLLCAWSHLLNGTFMKFRFIRDTGFIENLTHFPPSSDILIT